MEDFSDLFSKGWTWNKVHPCRLFALTFLLNIAMRINYNRIGVVNSYSNRVFSIADIITQVPP